MLSISKAFTEKPKRLKKKKLKKKDNSRTYSKLYQEKLSTSNIFAQSHSC